MNPKVRQTVLPFIAATLWGISFVFQKESTKLLGPFTFSALRTLLGFAVLALFILFRNKVIKKPDDTPIKSKTLWTGGVCCGVALFVATNLQQFGLVETDAGKTAFITALYIVLVPVFGLVIKKKAPALVWVSIAVAVVGMYFLCIKNGFTIESGDLLVLACAAAFAVQILIVDRFVSFVDGVKLSCIQMLVSGMLSAICALLTEKATLTAIIDCAVPILYLGIFSSGVAYTLQVVAQKGTNPTVVSLILSLESVIGAIASAIALKEQLLPREYIGSALMLVAVVLAQLPENLFKKRTN